MTYMLQSLFSSQEGWEIEGAEWKQMLTVASVLFTDATQASGRACFPAGGDFAPRGHMISGDIIGCHNWEGEHYWRLVRLDAH